MKKIFLFAPALLLMACGGETEEATDTVTDTVEEIVEEVEPIIEPVVTGPASNLSSNEEIQAFLEGKSWENEEAHESGMIIITDNPGEGEERPTLNDEVTIFYQGYLLDGLQFDGTNLEGRDGMPATFPLMQLIQGWQIGIPMFGKGGKGKLIIPSELAYGDMDNGEIPGGSTLLFEIELIDWQPYM